MVLGQLEIFACLAVSSIHIVLSSTKLMGDEYLVLSFLFHFTKKGCRVYVWSLPI